jgi:hypothetical protein
MLFTKPEEYLLPNPNQFILEPSPEDFKYAKNPAKGLSGDPSKPPRKQYTLMKQAPLPVEKPKFLRTSNSIDDIEGARSRALYRGIAKSILDINDIDGSQPKKVKERDLTQYNVFDWTDVVNKKGYLNLKEPSLPIRKPKESFYTKVNPLSTTQVRRSLPPEKLDLYKKDVASNFLYPTRFAYADTDNFSWKSHITRDFEPHLPAHYGVGSIKRGIE